MASSYSMACPMRWQNAFGFEGRVGAFVHDVFHEAVGVEGGDVDALGFGHGRGEVGAPVDDGAGALGRQRGKPGVLGRDGAVRGQERQGASAGALAQQYRQVGEFSPMRSCRDRAISPASPPSSASLERAAPLVSMTVSRGSPSSSASLMPRRASRSEAGPIAVCCDGRGRVWPMTTQDSWPKRARASRRPGSFSPCPVPLSGSTSLAP